MDIEPSSEQDAQSPYRKHFASVPLTGKDNVSIEESIEQQLMPPVKNKSQHCQQLLQQQHHQSQQQEQQQQKNGHYELVDSGRSFPSQKKNRTMKFSTTSTSSNSEQCQKCSRHHLHHPSHQHHHHHQTQYSIKQNSSNSGGGGGGGGSSAHEQCVQKQNTRTHHKSLSNRILSLKRENKTTQTLSIVVGGFIICWLPFFICYLITPFLPKNAINSTVNTALTWLGWFNSAMNPFIYAFYSVDFRAAFWRLTLRRFFKNSTKPPYSSNVMSIKR